MNSTFVNNMPVFVAGHQGMVGSAVVRALLKKGYNNIITADRQQCDLLDQKAVSDFFSINKINYVVLAAAKVGGISANNQYPADFIYENLMIEANVIHQAYLANIKNLLFLGSSCIYPKYAEQPIKESALLTGSLEPTNEPYAIAKIAGLKLCEAYNRQYDTDYRSVMPTNLYGPGDSFHLENSHVIPALMYKFYLAKLSEDGDLKTLNQIEQTQISPFSLELLTMLGLVRDKVTHKLLKTADAKPQVTVWGTGNARREFLHVDDLADACVFIMSLNKKQYQEYIGSTISHVNIGMGKDLTITELVEMIKSTSGFKGTIVFDSTKPDGTPRKLLDVAIAGRMGWFAKIALKEGLSSSYQWFVNHINTNIGEE